MGVLRRRQTSRHIAEFSGGKKKRNKRDVEIIHGKSIGQKRKEQKPAFKAGRRNNLQ